MTKLEALQRIPRENVFYKFVRADLSPEDWNKLLESDLGEKAKEVIRFLQERNNAPTSSEAIKEIWQSGCGQPMNDALRQCRLRFRIIYARNVPWNGRETAGYRLCAAEPKAPIIRYWE